MFPTDKVNTFDDTKVKNISSSKSLEFDFTKKEFVIQDGKTKEIYGVNAISQWVRVFLYTVLHRYQIYDGFDFGTSINEYIGLKKSNIGLIRSEMERQISENITINPYIRGIKNFDCEYQDSVLRISFIVILKDLSEIEVNEDVRFN